MAWLELSPFAIIVTGIMAYLIKSIYKEWKEATVNVNSNEWYGQLMEYLSSDEALAIQREVIIHEREHPWHKTPPPPPPMKEA